MNPDAPRTPREELEIKLVALLMGELPSGEAEALREQMAQDADLKRFHDELQKTLPLVREASGPATVSGAAPTPLRLSAARREALLARFRTVPLPRTASAPAAAAAPSPRPDRSWILSMSLAACLTALLGILAIGPELSSESPMAAESGYMWRFAGKAKARGGIVDSVGTAEKQLEVAQTWDEDAGRGMKAPPAAAMPAPLTPPLSQAPSGGVDGYAVAAPSGGASAQRLAAGKDVFLKKAAEDNAAGVVVGQVARQEVVPVVEAASSAEVRFGVPVLGRVVTPAEPAPPAPTSGRTESTPSPVLAKRYDVAAVPAPAAAPVNAPPPPAATVENKVKLESAAKSVARNRTMTRGAVATERFLEESLAKGVASTKEGAVTALGDVPRVGRLFSNGQAGFGGGGAGSVGGVAGGRRAGEANGSDRERVVAGNAFYFDKSDARQLGFEGTMVNALSERGQRADSLSEVDSLQRREVRDLAKSAGAAEEPLSRSAERLHTNVVLPPVQMLAIAPPAAQPLLEEARESKATAGDRVQGAEQELLYEAKVPALSMARRPSKPGLSPAPATAAPPPPPALDDQALKRRAAAPVPQPEVATADNAFSTFSLNVSDVSFKLADASLQNGTLPDPASVRTEEFLNALDYRDPEPPAGMPVAFNWEQARYPFDHNRDLLRLSIKTAARGREAGRALNLVLLLDNSGSMERADRVRIIRECLGVLAGQLTAQDKFSIITFARTAQLRADGVSGAQAAAEVEKVVGLTPDGGTNLEEALRLAYATAQRHFLSAGVNRVVLLTDGAANLGNVDPESLKKLVEARRRQGIALDSFGIGWEGYADDLLEVLTRNGDGRYGFINTPEDAASGFAAQLAGALQVAASDVKVQVEFNPKRVTIFRQLGYAKHQLTKEQFRDNTVDAAEIGAAESGNALYLVQVNPRGEGEIATVRVRFKVPGTSDYREHEWTVPYRGQAAPLAQASPSLRLAAVAGAFAEWLVSSPFAREVTSDALLGLMRGVPEHFGADTRPQRLEWMIRQAKSLSGR